MSSELSQALKREEGERFCEEVENTEELVRYRTTPWDTVERFGREGRSVRLGREEGSIKWHAEKTAVWGTTVWRVRHSGLS